MTPKDTTRKPRPVRARRSFLKTACGTAVAAAAAIGFPNVSRAQTVTWRFQSTWPQKDIFHEYAQDYARRVNEMSGPRFRLEVLPAGTVVGAFQMLDAVHAGALDGGHGVCAYWYGKHKAFSLFGTSPPFGWDANQVLGWIHYGGGYGLYRELQQQILKLNVVGFLTGPMPTQPLGWFKKEITSPEDLREPEVPHRRTRRRPVQGDGCRGHHPARRRDRAGDRSRADRRRRVQQSLLRPGAWASPMLRKIYMLQSFHQRVECFEIIFNKQKYDGLPPEQQAILKYAAEAASSDMSWKAQDRYSSDLIEMTTKQGVKAIKTPDSVLEAQLQAWDKVIAAQSEEPFFKRVIEFTESMGAAGIRLLQPVRRRPEDEL